jgi:uncharacterized metal-binding protein
MRSRPKASAWVQARTSPEEIQAWSGEAEELVVNDGCEDYCATKKLGEAGVGYPRRSHIVATECGIVKNATADVRYEGIEQMLRAVARIMESAHGKTNITVVEWKRPTIPEAMEEND